MITGLFIFFVCRGWFPSAFLLLRCTVSFPNRFFSASFFLHAGSFCTKRCTRRGQNITLSTRSTTSFGSAPKRMEKYGNLNARKAGDAKGIRKTKDIVKSLLSLFNLSPNSQQHANAKELALDGFFCYDG